jgi:glycosyltransferase involved in cell wall biosynthesis
MKILVLSNRLPFIRGGAEELSSNLVTQLRKAGHEAEEMRIPFSWEPRERLIDEMLIARSLRVHNVDRVIALKFPAYLVPHPCKVVWLLHQFRQAYDLFDSGMSHLGDDDEGRMIQSAIRNADEQALGSAHRLFALANAAERLQRYNAISAETLGTPVNDPELFRNEASEPYILAAGRVGAAKRQAMLIEALQHAPGVRLVVAGPPDSPEAASELLALARHRGVQDRLELDLRFLPRAELASRVNRCRAAIYVPYDEDSPGMVTLESFQASKPMITTTDSGGVLDVVKDGLTGLVVAPMPEALGAAMATLQSNARQAAVLGANARQLLDERQYPWPKAQEKLRA